MIDIIYRVTGRELDKQDFKSNRPIWFSKFNCLKSLLNSLSKFDNEFKLHFVYDGDGSRLLDYINSLTNVNVQKVNYKSNKNSLIHCLNFAKELNGDKIYFIEDDYLHLPNAMNILDEGIEKFSLVTLYDHTDRYTRNDDITKGHEIIDITKSCHWRTSESTTCTWACQRRLYNLICEDAIKFELNDRNLFRSLYNKNIRLFTPMPGMSTHLANDYMTPFTNWQNINNISEI